MSFTIAIVSVNVLFWMAKAWILSAKLSHQFWFSALVELFKHRRCLMHKGHLKMSNFVNFVWIQIIYRYAEKQGCNLVKWEK